MKPSPSDPTEDRLEPHGAAAPAVSAVLGRVSDGAARKNGATPERRRLGLLGAMWLLAGAALVFFGVFWALDLLIAGRASALRTGGIELFLSFDTETLQNTLGSLAQIIVAVLGIAITVVSIVVQLASTRYSSHIAGMFFRDRTNLTVMGFFVIACIDVVWVSLGVHGDFVPRVSVVVSLVVLSGSLLVLIPYFAYVFDFLDPSRVVARIGEATLASTDAAQDGVAHSGLLLQHQSAAAANLERLADVAVNSISQKDKVIAAHVVATFRHVLISYLGRKKALTPQWFVIRGHLREDSDFVAMAAASHQQIEDDRLWLEWKTLRQLRSIFSEALAHLPEIAHNVAIATRHVGTAAIANDDRPAIALCLKFFNTYLRTALNARDVRAAYNVFNEYRHLGEDIMARGLDPLSREVAGYFKYYAQTAHALGLGFVTETAAYDLSVLCETAYARKAKSHADLLRIFLEIDKEAETKAEEKALRGVRKAQIRLATFYLASGTEEFARTIFEDMRHEDRQRLASIRAELEAVTEKDFWEVTDRGINFDFLDAERKRQLASFFAWFGPLETSSTGPRRPPILS